MSVQLEVPEELAISVNCYEKRHRHCGGDTKLVRQHPTVPGANQSLPCLCTCHEGWHTE